MNQNYPLIGYRKTERQRDRETKRQRKKERYTNTQTDGQTEGINHNYPLVGAFKILGKLRVHLKKKSQSENEMCQAWQKLGKRLGQVSLEQLNLDQDR